MVWRVIQSEWLKVRKSSLWYPVILAPLLTIAIGMMGASHGLLNHANGNPWGTYYMVVVMAYSLLLLPLLTGVLCSLMCRFEHLSGGWKQTLAFPVPRTTLYFVKFLYVLVLVAIAQLLMMFGTIVTGLSALHITASVPWGILWKSILGGWLACIPLIALQLWVSTWWKSFGAPFALNIILTIPAVAVAHSSRFGPWYPWAQPMLIMQPGGHHFLNVTPKTTTTIVLSAVILIAAGWLHFKRRDITS